ncbi:START domain-containing protein [Giardia muris]|uniref:START domain-containing protein n=1 Tax=Giardia muris TaxID=5742 RepID=A0A4Z1T6Z3_GIAMU|nr:START domain-containing protein [Giardia muris]|eukprot:TNJ28309.1 START domain-containing protein [Giardia muris]
MPIYTGVVPPELWAHVDAEADNIVDACLTMLKDVSWKTPKTDEDLSVCVGSVPGSKFEAVRATMDINFPIASCIGALAVDIEINESSPADVRKRTLFRHEMTPNQETLDERTKSQTYVKASIGRECKAIPEMHLIMQFVTTSPSSIVAHREFVIAVIVRELPSVNGCRRAISALRSLTHPKLTDIFPEASKDEKWVRGFIGASCFLFEETSPGADKVKATFLSHADPMGKVPAMVANAVVINQGKALIRVSHHLEKCNQ